MSTPQETREAVSDSSTPPPEPGRRKCAYCGTWFMQVKHWQRFCKPACRRAWSRSKTAYGQLEHKFTRIIEKRGKEFAAVEFEKFGTSEQLAAAIRRVIREEMSIEQLRAEEIDAYLMQKAERDEQTRRALRNQRRKLLRAKKRKGIINAAAKPRRRR
jgi:hypothetical protein